MTALSGARVRPLTSAARRVALAALLALSAAGAARDAEAQMVPYAAIGVERVPMRGPSIEGLSGSSGLRFLLLVGLSHDAPGLAHGPEIEMGWLDEQRSQVDWTPEQGEAPLRLGLTAWTVRGAYRLAVPAHHGWPVRPYVRLGGSWARITDEWASDTPTEHSTSHIWGAHAGGGVELRLGGALWLSLSGTYSSCADSDDRPALSLDPCGWALGGRVGVSL